MKKFPEYREKRILAQVLHEYHTGKKYPSPHRLQVNVWYLPRIHHEELTTFASILENYERRRLQFFLIRTQQVQGYKTSVKLNHLVLAPGVAPLS